MNFETLLDASRASESFKSALLALARGEDHDPERVSWSMGSPRIKVLRVLAHLMESHPELPLETVTIDGFSGCSDYRGSLHVQTNDGTRRFEFVWCCRWRAEQEGWTDYFGFPDQQRAVREFGHRCFEVWRSL